MIRARLKQILQNELKRGPKHFLADAFALLVIMSSVAFLAYDSLYMLRRYLPRIIRKVKHRVMIDPDAEEALQGKTLDLGKALRGSGNNQPDDD
jgi:hypothetical protein